MLPPHSTFKINKQKKLHWKAKYSYDFLERKKQEN